MSDNLKQRFQQHSISPPASAWDDIAIQLSDSQQNTTIAAKVRLVEMTPPAEAWDYIFAQIAGSSSRTGRLSRLFTTKTIGKAAAVAGILMIGSFFLLTQRNSKADLEPGEIAINKPTKKQELTDIVPDRKAVKQSSSLLPKISSLYSSLGMKKKIYAGARRKLYKTFVKVNPVEVPLVSIRAKPIRDEEGEIIQETNSAASISQKYLSVTGPNGQQTKISAKFASLLLYLNDDDDTDEKEGVFTKSFLESLLWKARFQSWRNTISQTAYIPSSTNFMDILEFKDLILQENDFN